MRFVIRNRDWFENAILVLVLPFVAGAVNASGFMMLGVYTSHVTGNVARIGDELAQGRADVAIAAALLVVAFYVGAVLATALVALAKSHRRARYSFALLAEAGALVLVLVLAHDRFQAVRGAHTLAVCLLGLSMGMQNALVTKLSGAVVRTTHVTGIVTDLAIETVRLVGWFRESTRGRPLLHRFTHVWHSRAHDELKRLRLHLAIFGSFFSGAIIGPLLYVFVGEPSMVAPILVLFGLVAFDTRIGFRDPTRRKGRGLKDGLRMGPRARRTGAVRSPDVGR
ncbi:MAG: YoaK family protein [Myxococcaceae bacterium]